jgi:DNA-binding NarL/FixJ family response regulator
MFNKMQAGVPGLPRSTQAPVTVLLADPYQTPREALERLLEHERSVQVVASADTMETAAAAARRLAPDVLVVDEALIARGGDILQGWGPVGSAMDVVVMGMETHRALARKLMERGATAYLLKDRLADDLVATLLAGGPRDRSVA